MWANDECKENWIMTGLNAKSLSDKCTINEKGQMLIELGNEHYINWLIFKTMLLYSIRKTIE